MDSSSLSSNCFKWSVLNNGQLEFTFIFQNHHSPLCQNTEYKFHSPLCRNTEYQISFPALSEHGISNFHSPLCRNTEYQCHSPLCRNTEYQISIPRFVGTRNIKFHSPLFRSTEYQMSFPALSEHGISMFIPRLSEYGISNFIPRLAGLRKFTQIQFSQVSFPVCRMTKCQKKSSPVCLVQRCHQSNVYFYKPSVYKYISKYNYQHGSEQSLFPSETTVSPGGVGSLSSTNLGIPFHSKQIIFVIPHS